MNSVISDRKENENMVNPFLASLKDEFLSMVDNALGLFGVRLEELASIFEYFKRTSRISEFETTKIKNEVFDIRNKVTAYKGITSLPLYLRIQTMSDIELNDCKEFEIFTIDSEIATVQAQEALPKVEFDELSSRNSLMEEYKNTIIDEDNNAKILNLQQKKEQIINMSIDEFKRYLCNKYIQQFALNESTLNQNFAIPGVEPFKSLSNDPGKIKNIVELISNYRAIYNQKINNETDFNFIEQYNSLKQGQTERGENTNRSLQDIYNDIMSLTGISIDDVNTILNWFPPNLDMTIEDIEKTIKDNIIKAYRAEMASTVKEEAQRQSDLREAELRGISLEELLESRYEQTLDTSMKDEQSFESSGLSI